MGSKVSKTCKRSFYGGYLKLKFNIEVTFTINEKHPYYSLGGKTIKDAIKYSINEYFEDCHKCHNDVDTELLLRIRDTLDKKSKQNLNLQMDQWIDSIEHNSFVTTCTLPKIKIIK